MFHSKNGTLFFNNSISRLEGLNLMKSKKLIENMKWISFVIPCFIFYTIFFFAPSLSAIYYSFTQWDGVNSKFIGLTNYSNLFHDPEILTSMGNTIFYTVSIVLIQNALGIFFAVLLKKGGVRNNILRTLIFMPHIFSSLLIGYVFKFMLEPNTGSINNILTALNLECLIKPWLTDPSVAKWIIVLVTVWQCVGYTMVINIAGLQAISDDYYEAAAIDGASRWTKFRKITFPLMAPATTINIVLSLVGDLQIFNQIYTLTAGGPGYETESVAITIYRLGFGSSGARWGYGAAMSVVMFVVMMIVTVITTTFLRKREADVQ